MTDSPALPAPPWRIAVDVGGTFTDMVLVDAGGRFHVFKTPSVPADPSRGVLDVLEHAARAFGADVGRLLSDCTLFLHGSTVATNTVLEGRGARVGMLVTRGFRDFLEARRGFRANPFDHRPPYPPVLVPRYLRRPVGGRMDARGAEVEPLDEADLDAAIETFRAEGVESVAVCLLHSFENGAHERRCAEGLHARGGFEWVSLSHEVAPIIGEYERGSTTVVNAYVGPKVVRYLQALDERLRTLGLGPDLLVLQSNGRAISTRQVAHCPVNLVLSGPAGGVGALDYFAAATGFDDLITMEIGGTSCDVMLRAGGRVAVTDRLEVGGYDLVSASVDIHTVGAGGGTIAGADAAGLLFAGPRGAGAVPGPAAYGRGGEEPTVTDVQLVLGRLAPGPYAGGAVSLDLERARAALRTRVAEPLGIGVREAAIGVIRLVEQNLLQAVERISIERGRDPARFVLVAGGGAGPMHGAAVGRRLGARGVLVPRLAGVFCALGMLNADVGQDFARVFIAPLDEDTMDEVRSVYAGLEGDGRAWLREGGFETGAMRFEPEADLRYAGQQWDVRVTDAKADVGKLRAAFEREHDRLFGHVQPDSTVELTRLRVVGIGTLPPLVPARAEPGGPMPVPVSTREVYAFGPRGEPLGFAPTPVYRGADLLAGHRLDGPLLVEERTTTVVAGPGDRLEVLASGDLFIRFDHS
ncbi:MAG: hydantoinase/oxoprolinase family protein [Thiotrichales bacterium]|nr:hydantoinase/oxoprolinase family protein [Thiotrichales bacterium]